MIADCSVLISIHNKCSEFHFIECILSLDKQTLKPAELVIVQDGELSFDLENTVMTLTNIPSLFVYNRFCSGLPYSLNKGLSKCTFNIVFRMDADDVCHEDRILIQYPLFIENPDLTVLGSNVTLIDFDSKEIDNLRNVPLTNNRIRRLLLLKNPFNHPTVVFRRDKILAVGGYSDLDLYEDWFLWIKLSKLNGVLFSNVDRNLLSYRIRSFEERRGMRLIKIEYLFYRRLFLDGDISLIYFVGMLLIRSVVRLFPKESYKFFKHLFDKLSML
jgi:glycosyltransferase involved in cell wall biosynthesis